MINKLIKKINEIFLKRRMKSILQDSSYEDMQEFIYKDLDMFKDKIARAAYIKSLPQVFSKDAEQKLNQLEIERYIKSVLEKQKPVLDELKKIEELEKKYSSTKYSSPIPRHVYDPKNFNKNFESKDEDQSWPNICKNFNTYF